MKIPYMFLWSWIEFQHTYCELHPNHLYKSNPILKATQLLFFFFLFFFIFTFTLSCFFFSSSYSLEPSSRKEDDKSCNLYFLSPDINTSKANIFNHKKKQIKMPKMKSETTYHSSVSNTLIWGSHDWNQMEGDLVPYV